MSSVPQPPPPFAPEEAMTDYSELLGRIRFSVEAKTMKMSVRTELSLAARAIEALLAEVERLTLYVAAFRREEAKADDLEQRFEDTKSAIETLTRELVEARAGHERERMRLAACGVVALADTPQAAAKQRDMHPDYRSASCDDVARRVDECMTLRAELTDTKARLAEAVALLQHRGGPLCMARYYSECECDCGVGPFLAKQESKP